MIMNNQFKFALIVWVAFLMSPVCSAGDSQLADQVDEGLPHDVSVWVPPDDGYDWLQLTSGEWLKGEFVSLIDDEVKFDSEILEELTLDIEDVKALHSPQEFGVRIRGQETVSGKIRVEQQRVVVTTDSGERVILPEDLLAITVAAERERDHWSGNLILGINLRQGNSEYTEYNMMAGVERRTPRSRAVMDYIGNFNETEGEQIANNHRVNAVFDRFSGSRLFWRPVIGQYFKDPFQNIRHQVTLETGLGYELINNSRTKWEIFAGAGVNHVRRVSVGPEEASNSNSPAWSLGTHFETELTSWMDYLFTFHATFLDEESGEYQHHLVTTLSTDLVRNIDFDVTFVWDRTGAPPPRADGTPIEKDDFRLMTGIGFDF